jgi:CBS domain containing-hemolysin-like protein
MSTDTLLWFGIFAALLACNAFFVAIEFALVATRPSRVQELIDSGNAAARVVQRLQQNINTSVSGAQLGITFASLAIGWVCEPSIRELLEWALRHVPGMSSIHIPEGVAMGAALLVASAIHAVIGEQVPKCTALRMPENAALVLCRPFSVYCRVMWPMIWTLDKVTAGVLRVIGIKRPAHEHAVHSADELEILFDQSEQAGEIDARSNEMLKGVFDLDELTATQLMVPRAKMDCIDRRLSLREAFAVASKTKHSKLPVLDGPDRVIGVLYAKDLFDVIQAHMQAVSQAVTVTIPTKFKLDSLVRKPYRIKPDMTARAILDGMRKRRVQIAIVTDDQNKVLGLITMEDIMERLVGPIHDEHDKMT